LESNQAYKTI